MLEDIKKSSKRLVKKVAARTGVANPFKSIFKDVEFETTAHCNRACPYCPVSMYPRDGDMDDTYMREEVFEKILKDLQELDFRGMVAPHLYGEPLTDPRLVDWMARTRKALPNCKIKVVTNGDYLNRGIYQDLLKAGVDVFNLSKHGKNLSDGAVELLESLTQQEREERFNLLDFYSNYMEDQSMFNTRGGEVAVNKSGKKNPIMCSYVVYPVINTFGDVVLCCNDYNSEYKFGNVMERSLKDIWFDKENVRVRSRIYKGYMDYKICQDCYM